MYESDPCMNQTSYEIIGCVQYLTDKTSSFSPGNENDIKIKVEVCENGAPSPAIFTLIGFVGENKSGYCCIYSILCTVYITSINYIVLTARSSCSCRNI